MTDLLHDAQRLPLSGPVDRVVDASALACPMPLLKARQALRQMMPGQRLEVQARDRGSLRDIPAYVRQSCHQLVSQGEADGLLYFVIRVGQES